MTRTLLLVALLLSAAAAQAADDRTAPKPDGEVRRYGRATVEDVRAKCKADWRRCPRPAPPSMRRSPPCGPPHHRPTPTSPTSSPVRSRSSTIGPRPWSASARARPIRGTFPRSRGCTKAISTRGSATSCGCTSAAGWPSERCTTRRSKCSPGWSPRTSSIRRCCCSIKAPRITISCERRRACEPSIAC